MMAGPIASTSAAASTHSDGEEAPTFAFRKPRRKDRIKNKAQKQDGTEKGKGKAKDDFKGYEVGSGKLGKYLNESEEVAKRDQMEWRKRTHNDKKLSKRLAGMSSSNLQMASSAAEHDDLLLPAQSSGALLVPETELEKTYKVSQSDIVSASGVAAASKSFGLSLSGGPFSFDYSRNGRHLVLAGRSNGHLAALDWKASRPMTEVHVNETTKAVRWLHDESFFAAAQRRYVYIYDGRQGLEVHQLRGHIEVNAMEFLPYHFLLATIGNPGWLKYHDTSTGQVVAELRTKLGGCDTMCVNPHSSIVHLGHQNGTVTLWSPSLSQPHVKLLAHLGPVTSLSVDPSSSGRLLASTGMDGTVKVWDMRNDWKPLASWSLKRPPSSVAWSQKGLLAVGWGPHVSMYAGVGRQGSAKGAYMTQLFPGEEVRQVSFCPHEDVLGVGHTAGFTSLLVPGAGEAHIDSLEADPYEASGRRREREVKGLLEKIPADLITMDPDFVGSVREPEAKENPEKAEIRRRMEGKRGEKPFRTLSRAERLEAQGRKGIDEDNADDGEGESRVAGQEDDAPGEGTGKAVKEKKKMRGKNSSLKRLMRKKRKNVITPETEAIKAKIAKRREEHVARKEGKAAGSGALARFGK